MNIELMGEVKNETIRKLTAEEIGTLRVKNETLHKLTAEEIGVLGLLNYGIMTYKGTLKKRRQGFKTEKVSEYQTNFIPEFVSMTRVEFIEIQRVGEEKEYAMRIYDEGREEYCKIINVLFGIQFLK